MLLQTTCLLATDSIGFVYEIVRHGARAPLLEEPEGFFKVKMGQLTASGMRQRLLLGKHNRERYVNKYHLLDEQFNPN